jgi:hypothetical protein
MMNDRANGAPMGRHERADKVLKRVVIAMGAFLAYAIGDAMISATVRATGKWEEFTAFGALFAALACAIGMIGCMAWLTFVSERKPVDPPRPDYALIASMEREIYGEAFHHDGAPEVAMITGRDPFGMITMAQFTEGMGRLMSAAPTNFTSATLSCTGVLTAEPSVTTALTHPAYGAQQETGTDVQAVQLDCQSVNPG